LDEGFTGEESKHCLGFTGDESKHCVNVLYSITANMDYKDMPDFIVTEDVTGVNAVLFFHLAIVKVATMMR